MVFIFLDFASFLIIYDVFNISLVCVNIIFLVSNNRVVILLLM